MSGQARPIPGQGWPTLADFGSDLAEVVPSLAELEPSWQTGAQFESMLAKFGRFRAEFLRIRLIPGEVDPSW